ncbi:hypothetical protein T11_16671 [Trichinella zimbabwensis]|uniref:Uncharacterized protein n=1 Tax=Trichinella zimbabwensis TaxID=268475 RepID=A0A0V1GY83_9BILA|nr:hypothetical protein T11_16671 [Trichinella zimbabwensis]
MPMASADVVCEADRQNGATNGGYMERWMSTKLASRGNKRSQVRANTLEERNEQQWLLLLNEWCNEKKSEDFHCEREAVVNVLSCRGEQCYCFLHDRISVHGCGARYLGEELGKITWEKEWQPINGYGYWENRALQRFAYISVNCAMLYCIC